MDGQYWLHEIETLYRRYKLRCEKAVAQVPKDRLFEEFGKNPNSIAVLLKHMGSNHRSRWRNFLTEDGEKQDRHRDDEFVVENDSLEGIMARWDEGWQVALDSLASLRPSDLERTVTVRGEPLTVIQAIHRNLNHVVYHTGQIVHMARHFAGDDWQTLSIAPGRSDEHNEEMREKYGDWWRPRGGSAES